MEDKKFSMGWTENYEYFLTFLNQEAAGFVKVMNF